VGRPTKRTPHLEAALLQALRAGNTREAACHYAGIDLHTLSRWMRFATFATAIEKAETDAEVRFVAQIAKAAQDGTWQAAVWWLERRRPLDYGRTWLTASDDAVAAPMHVTVTFDQPKHDVFKLPAAQELA
jgi:hypothetical protein